MNIKIGKNIRKVRELRCLTQEELADKLGLSQNAYSKLERDETEMTLNKLLKIAELLNVNFLDLIGFDENKLFFNQSSHDNSNGVILNQINESSFLKEQYESRIVDMQKEINYLRNMLEKVLTK
ncbi:MAG: XRE family transcriptional regulator [Cytophagia bacterium]|nr:MAG: XRE family transcriptional regulator [Cytophagia bacterium]TAG46020.1 MAG: XRE family transcriptional regulator [Cytophagia bacterium]